MLTTSLVMTPSIEEIAANHERLKRWIAVTPVWQCRTDRFKQQVGNIDVLLKLELWQVCGSFKARGALTWLSSLSTEERQHGVIAASAGNHAVAVSFAAKTLGISAKVIMPKTASPVRMERCRSYGAEVLLVDTLADAFPKMEAIAAAEKRSPIHPFEGRNIVLGTATIGLEISQQIADLDAIVVPIGGGGLCAGIAAFIKQVWPHCAIYGVEPEGADSMYRSLQAGKIVPVPQVNTIADSLALTQTQPYIFSLCQQWVDEVVTVSDAAIKDAMRLMFQEMKLALEPAAAVSMAAICGPLQARLTGKRVAAVLSGTNIDIERFYQLTKVE